MLQEWSDCAPSSRRERIGLRLYVAVMVPVMLLGTVLSLVSLYDQARAIWRWLSG